MTTTLGQICFACKWIRPNPCGMMVTMTDTGPATQVKTALAAHRRASKHAEETLATLHAAIAVAAAQGVRQNELVKITGYTRERIRQICRAG
jgi:hypothetical protein